MHWIQTRGIVAKNIGGKRQQNIHNMLMMCAVTQKGILHESEGIKQYQIGWQSIFLSEKIRRRKNREQSSGTPLKAKAPQAIFSNHPARKFRCGSHGFISPDLHSPPNALMLSQVLCPPYQFTRKKQLFSIPQKILWNPVNNQLQILPLAWLQDTGLLCHLVVPASARVRRVRHFLFLTCHLGTLLISFLPPQHPSTTLSQISNIFFLLHSFFFRY